MPLTGYEETSVVEVGAVLDDSPATAEEVYLRTIGHSERAIAAVAAKRAGSSGSVPAGGTTGQVLTKASNANGDADWETANHAQLAAGFYIPPGATESVSPGSDVLFSWHHSGESVFLDLADPQNPLLLADGTYSFVVQVWSLAATQAGKLLGARLVLDAANEAFYVVRNAPLGPAVVGPQNGEVGMTPTMFLQAGSVINLYAGHNADAALDFSFLAIIQKLG